MSKISQESRVSFVNKEQYINSFTSDGEGVVVAILDTGVDPSVDGLRTTSHKKPKVIDIVDCTGCGDIDTSESFDKSKISDLDEDFANGLTDSDILDTCTDLKIGHAFLSSILNLNANPVKSLDGLKDRLKYSIVNVVTGMDKEGEPMSFLHINNVFSGMVEDYGKRQRYYKIKHNDRSITFGVKYYNKYNTISLVFESGSHGTHVAGIVGAHFVGQPDKCGVAPGAQIVSLKIGDNRLDGMETTQSLVRAMNEIVNRDIHLVNLSFGESVNECKSGILVNMIEKYCRQHNIIFVTSAGNSGPSMMTIGAPATSTSDVISVGAYVNKDMMETLYFRDGSKFTDGVYSWSSRGVTNDGHEGVSVIAPGGATTTVSSWCRENLDLMNGTSMASPYACGCVARVLSSLEKIPYFYWVKRALMNTAKDLDDHDPISHGAGLVNPEDMKTVLLKDYDYNGDYGFDVDCEHNGKSSRGVLLQNIKEDKKERYTINIKPFFRDRENKEFSRVVNVSVSSNIKNHIEIPKTFFINNHKATIAMYIDTEDIDETIFGKIDFTLSGTDYVAFSLPVTVLLPDKIMEPDKKIEKSVDLHPNETYRLLFTPSHRNIVVKIKSMSETISVLSSLSQFIPSVSYEKQFKRKYHREPTELTLQGTPNCITELAISSYLSNTSCKVEFVVSAYDTPRLDNNILYHDGTFRVYVEQCMIDSGKMTTKNKLDKVTSVVHPHRSEIKEKVERMLSSDKFNYESFKDDKSADENHILILHYSVPKCSGKYKINVPIDNDIYESKMTSSGYIIGYFCNKPCVFGNHYDMKVNVCEIDRLEVRFVADKNTLEKMKSTPLIFTKSMDIDVDCYATRDDSMKRSDSVNKIKHEGSYFFRPDFSDIEFVSEFNDYTFTGDVLGSKVTVVRNRKRKCSSDDIRDDDKDKRNKSTTDRSVEKMDDWLSKINPSNIDSYCDENKETLRETLVKVRQSESLHDKPDTYVKLVFLEHLIDKDNQKKKDTLSKLLKARDVQKTYPYCLLNIKENLSVIKSNISNIKDYEMRDHLKIEMEYEENYDKKKYLRYLTL